MPSRSPNSKLFQYVGIVAALVGIFGYTVLGWRFGGPDQDASLLIGVVVAVLAVGWTIHQRV